MTEQHLFLSEGFNITVRAVSEFIFGRNQSSAAWPSDSFERDFATKNPNCSNHEYVLPSWWTVFLANTSYIVDADSWPKRPRMDLVRSNRERDNPQIDLDNFATLESVHSKWNPVNSKRIPSFAKPALFAPSWLISSLPSLVCTDNAGALPTWPIVRWG